MKKDQKVIVYDGDLLGYVQATLINRYSIVEEGVLEKWLMETVDGTRLVRFVKNHSNKIKDGCGYIIEE